LSDTARCTHRDVSHLQTCYYVWADEYIHPCRTGVSDLLTTTTPPPWCSISTTAQSTAYSKPSRLRRCYSRPTPLRVNGRATRVLARSTPALRPSCSTHNTNSPLAPTRPVRPPNRSDTG